MRTISVIIDYAMISPEEVENKIYKDIPCWCGYKKIDDNYFEFYITCREEDVPYVERKLAPYM